MERHFTQEDGISLSCVATFLVWELIAAIYGFLSFCSSDIRNRRPCLVDISVQRRILP